MLATYTLKWPHAIAATVLSLGVSFAQAAYWNVFNIEGESSIDAAFATYATLPDMLNDENRTGTFVADGSGIFGANIVDAGSDGRTYWNVFNIEGESSVDAAFATYATLPDMLNDENRTGTFVADGSGIFGANIVGSGSDGRSYWNVFNIEGESSVDAAFATYSTLPDMLNDENRTGTFVADGSGIFGANIVGSGASADIMPSIPEPTSSTLLALGLALIGLRAWRRGGCQRRNFRAQRRARCVVGGCAASGQPGVVPHIA